MTGLHWWTILCAFASALVRCISITLDNKKSLDEFVGNAKSCVYRGDEEALRAIMTGEFSVDDIFVKNKWMYPIACLSFFYHCHDHDFMHPLTASFLVKI